MNIRACLFDLDGVLVDTARFHYLAWKQLAGRLGFDFAETDNERLKGISRMDSLEILLSIGNVQLTTGEKKQYAEEKNQIYLQYVSQMTPGDILPGVNFFLKELKANNIFVGLGSASKNARLILQKTHLEAMFDVVIDGNLISKAKPDPEVFSLGARLLEVDARETVVFEDAVAGVQAAHNAGMKCIGIGSPEMLAEADLVFPGFENLKLADIRFV
ncbi:MAG: beta-phosphoglucomutase [Bacteroidales bacterium]|nr:beta-phosphoglucomutase [Bacteroidales bacterium]